MFKQKLLGLLIVAGVSGSAAATTSGFEDGVGPFSRHGSVSLVSEFSGLTATEGSRFALLKSDSPVSTSGYGGTNGTIMGTHLTLAAGEGFSFDWAFKTDDYMPYNDFALFIGGQSHSLADVSTVGNYGRTGWNTFTWNNTEAYDGSVEWVVSNRTDQAYQSYLLIDNIDGNISAPVPEPGTYALMLVGLGLVSFAAKRRRA